MKLAVATTAALAALMSTAATAQAATGGTASGTASTAAPAARAERAADAQKSPTAAAAAAAQPISRNEVITRAKSWLIPSVPYSQSAYHSNQYGTYRTDCSGYVSMTWGLPGKPQDPNGGTNTVGLTQISDAIGKEDLRAGDALIDASGNENTRHAVLFEKWADAAHTSYWGYEQAGGTGTIYRKIPYPYSSTPGDYKPYRYRNIVDGGPHGSSVSGDGKADIVTVLDNGDVKAWRNGAGFAEMPWDADVVIGQGFTKDDVHFADLDGDGKSEIITVLDNGDVKAWHNGRG
ncbi:FG-GAP-like repeat-containing protein, partial [Streptomyces sp. NPDC007917]|uniref:FG-GAP repeat domain-containing protein n=1 Tax=Streptomyces sp. NPDC007917 TaxID=3364793 RepID=UPI0036E5BBF1